jgi:hypothetical protein
VTIKAILFGTLLLLPLASAGAETLAVKTGEWVVTSTLHMEGPLLSPDVMARLPPQLRAQMEGAMGQMRKPQTHRSCLTQEKLDKGFDLNDHHHGTCQPTVVRQTSTVLEINGSCSTSHGDMTEHGIITATSGETMSGHFDMVNVSGGEGPKNVSVDLTGHWLGAACSGKDGDPG